MRIFEWFKRAYGERLNTDLNRGYSAMMIRGDLYRLRFLTFFGRAAIVAKPEWIGRTFRARQSDGSVIQVINLLEHHIEALTLDSAHRLKPEECEAIVEAYLRMERAFGILEVVNPAQSRYTTEVADDLKAAASYLLAERPNFGFSRWSSLQAAEKIVKSYIIYKGGVPERHHSLAKLCQAAYNFGLPNQNSAKLDTIQCSAEIRYNSKRATKEEAVTAHYATLEVCGDVAELLPHL